MYKTDETTINKINSVIDAYFSNNPSATIVPVKKLMPDFIQAGIFSKDRKNGAPIRTILKELDHSNRLELIPTVYPERHDLDTYWYFIPTNAPKPTTPYKQEKKKTETKIHSYESNDKSYVIDLCDKVIGMKANRKKRFDFLLGDLHKDGVSQTKLPVDAFYTMLQLVVQYQDYKPWEPIETIVEELEESDEDENLIEGTEKKIKRIISREEQRFIYDERRKKEFLKHDIDFVALSFADFKHDSELKIIRNEADDLKIIHKALKEFISTE